LPRLGFALIMSLCCGTESFHRVSTAISSGRAMRPGSSSWRPSSVFQDSGASFVSPSLPKGGHGWRDDTGLGTPAPGCNFGHRQLRWTRVKHSTYKNPSCFSLTGSRWFQEGEEDSSSRYPRTLPPNLLGHRASVRRPGTNRT